MRQLLVALGILAIAVNSTALGYGHRGHAFVGAVADARLDAKPAAKMKVAHLTGGLSLETVAVFADTVIKSNSSSIGFDSGKPLAFVLSHHPELQGHTAIANELYEFYKANKDTPPGKHEKRHHLYHYTDAPVRGTLKYADGGVGQDEFDIVHAIPRCIRVLRGTASAADNERKITPSVAVILLAHYVGDIHQPLHVGAEYFDATGQPVNPAAIMPFEPDTGGNKIFPHFVPSGNEVDNLHAYWDNDAVNLALAEPTSHDATLAKAMAMNEPAGWQPAASLDPEQYAEAWANEILPIALKAHEQLTYTGIETVHQHGQAQQMFGASVDGTAYPKFAGDTVRRELQLAGWRLADLLEKIVP